MDNMACSLLILILSQMLNICLKIPGLGHLLRLSKKDKPPQTDEELLASCHQVIRSSLLKLRYHHVDIPPDPDLRFQGLALVDSWTDIDEATTAQLRAAIEPAMQAMDLLYPSLSREPKALVGVLTATVIWMELHFDSQPERFETFHADFMAGRPGKHALFKHVFCLLMRLYDHYEAYVAYAMVTSYFTFVQAEVHEVRVRRAGMVVDGNAPHYPMWARWQHAVTVLYCWAPFERARFPETAAFVQATPDIGMFICHLNDVLSFPKEHIAGERNNPVYLNAKIHSKTLSESFRDTLDAGLEARSRALKTVKNDAAATEILQQFFDGYIQFHLVCPRYKYSEEFTASCATPETDKSPLNIILNGKPL